MTQRYAHLSPRYMAGAVAKLDRVFSQVMSTDVEQNSIYIQEQPAAHLDQKDGSAPLLEG
jgi:hypothetical protein